MIISLTTTIQWLLAYKYLILFPMVVIEGPLTTIAAGFLSSTGHLNLYIAYGTVVVGDVVGDCLYYTAGRRGVQFVGRWGKYIGLTLERVQKIEDLYAHHPKRTLILGKLAYSIETPFLVAAGLAKVPYQTFLIYILIPTIPKSLFFVLIGYYFGRAIEKIIMYINYTSLLVPMIVFFSLSIYFLVIRKTSQTHVQKK